MYDWLKGKMSGAGGISELGVMESFAFSCSHQLGPPGGPGVPGRAEAHSPADVPPHAAAERGRRPHTAGPAR